mmetsp:Transcript_3087/g.4602  ORF Transcript_3087/g.4602 Transcript_3087/m.4602 type:complete len:111 (-) Transcript_3087:175-507(-)
MEKKGSRGKSIGIMEVEDVKTRGIDPRIDTIFSALVEELCLDICFEAHHRHYFLRHVKARSKNDIFGNYPKNSIQHFNCINCQRPVSSTKFAPHLEKCLGRGGRNRSKRS